MLLLFCFLSWKIIHHIWHYCSALKCFEITYDNKIFRIITTLLKALRHIPTSIQSIESSCLCSHLYLHSVHEGMHIYAQFNTELWCIWHLSTKLKILLYSYLHTCVYTVQKQQVPKSQLSLSVLKRCKHGYGHFHFPLPYAGQI